MFVSLVPARQDAMEHPGELTAVVLSLCLDIPHPRQAAKLTSPKPTLGAGKPSYKFTLSIHGAQRGSSFLLPLSEAL